MTQENKQQDQRQPKLFRFILAWFLAWLAAGWLSVLLLSRANSFHLESYLLAYFALLGALEFVAIRRFLHVALRRWIFLTIAGSVTGIVSYHIIPALFYNNIPFFLILPITYLLLYSTPLIFQWMALRKRYRYHALYLLAALTIAPLGAYLMDTRNDGVFKNALRSLGLLTDSSASVLQTIANTADAAIPAVVLGLVLFVVVKQGGKTDAFGSAAE